MGVFEAPAALGLALKMQGRRQLFTGQCRGQVKPEKTRRPRSMPAEAHLPGRKLNEPTVRRGLRGNHGHGRFVELKQTAALLIVCEYQIAADFRHSTARPPERLADLDIPAGTRRCEQTFGGRLAAAEKREAGQQNWPEKMTGQTAFE